MLSEALSFWNAIAGKVSALIKGETKNAMRCERYEVTTAPNGTKIGVTLPMGSNEIFLPYSNEVASATVGTPVLVVWWGSMSNAKVCYFADGYRGTSLLNEHPVGSYYWSDDPTSPASLFGGTWLAVEDVFVLAAGTVYSAGATGGAATVALNDVKYIPAHDHGNKSLSGYTHLRRYNGSNQNDIIGVNGSNGIVSVGSQTWSGSHAQITSGGTTVSNPTVDRITVNASHTHDSVGSGTAHENMPPYVAAYCWKRTA